MKKTYKEVQYKCDYCDFVSTNPKETGIHEFNCEHRPENEEEKIERIRRIAKKTIYLSYTLSEVNDNIRNYLKEFYPKEVLSFSSIKISSNNSRYYFFANYGTTDRLLDKLKISVRIEDYPNIFSKILRITDIKSGSEVVKYITDFNNHIEFELNKFEKTDTEMIRLNENIKTLSDSIYKMQKDLQNSKDIHKTKINQKIDEIKKEYNYIDYSIERKQLESELGL